MIRWLFTRVMVLAVPLWFDADKAEGVDGKVELRVAIHGRLSYLTVQIDHRACAVRPGPAADAGAAATIALADLIRLIIGDASWPQLLSRGRLQLSGDAFLALRLPALFRLPAGARRKGSHAAIAVGSR